MVDGRLGEGFKSKLYMWYICTECSEEKRTTPCVLMVPRGTTQLKNKISPERVDRYIKQITPLFNCVVPTYKKPKWIHVTPTELITMINSDPLVSQEYKLVQVDETTDKPNAVKKQFNRFTEIDLIEP